jgi:hypothetical protein
MSDWISDTRAVELVREARKISGGPAIKLLIDACAQGLVRARQRLPRDDWGPVIPPSVWRDAHLDLDTGLLIPAGVDLDNPPVDERGYVSDGGYGLGGNGVIEISEADLREYLGKPAPRKRGRKTKIDWADVKQKIFARLEYQGAPSAFDPEWANQAAVEKAIQEILEQSGIAIAESTARTYAGKWLDEWQAEKGR